MVFQLFRFGAKKRRLKKVRPVYDLLLKAARTPYFYKSLGVPDTLSGRFDMIVLHQFMLFYRLKKETTPLSKQFGQDVFDIFIEDMDRSLREMGVGYQAVPKRMKNMGEAFYGRIAAYDAAMQKKDADAFSEAIKRNIFTDIESDALKISALTDYVFQSVKKLEEVPFEALNKGQFSFADCSVFLKKDDS